jgi:hypothetical protein
LFLQIGKDLNLDGHVAVPPSIINFFTFENVKRKPLSVQLTCHFNEAKKAGDGS